MKCTIPFFGSWGDEKGCEHGICHKHTIAQDAGAALVTGQVRRQTVFDLSPRTRDRGAGLGPRSGPSGRVRPQIGAAEGTGIPDTRGRLGAGQEGRAGDGEAVRWESTGN